MLNTLPNALPTSLFEVYSHEQVQLLLYTKRIILGMQVRICTCMWYAASEDGLLLLYHACGKVLGVPIWAVPNLDMLTACLGIMACPNCPCVIFLLAIPVRLAVAQLF
jgi:hypothetical protein